MPEAKEKLTSRDIKAQERRQQILAVAKQLFAKGGYHATSMRSLNKALGVAEALTYHYFPGGKLEILQTVIREGYATRFAEIEVLEHTLQEDLSLREALLLVAHIGTTILLADKELLHIVVRERNWLRQEEWVATLDANRASVQSLFSFFARRMAQGEIRAIDLSFAFMQFFSSILVHSFLEDATDEEAYIEQLVDFTVSTWSR